MAIKSPFENEVTVKVSEQMYLTKHSCETAALAPMEHSDQGLHFSLVHLHILDTLLHCEIKLFHFKAIKVIARRT